jgi:TPR repeat protein
MLFFWVCADRAATPITGQPRPSSLCCGSGVPRDYSEAFQWFLKAAKQGYVRAQANVGVAYATGKGTQLDYVQAYFWLNLAVVHGDSGSIGALKELRKVMTVKQTLEAERNVKTSALR